MMVFMLLGFLWFHSLNMLRPTFRAPDPCERSVGEFRLRWRTAAIQKEEPAGLAVFHCFRLRNAAFALFHLS